MNHPLLSMLVWACVSVFSNAIHYGKSGMECKTAFGSNCTICAFSLLTEEMRPCSLWNWNGRSRILTRELPRYSKSSHLLQRIPLASFPMWIFEHIFEYLYDHFLNTGQYICDTSVHANACLIFYVNPFCERVENS